MGQGARQNIFWSLALVLLSSCALDLIPNPLATPIASVDPYLKVAFINSPPSQCGVAALQMAMQFEKVPIDIVDLRKMLTSPGEPGTLPFEMVAASRRSGFTVHYVKSLSEVEASLHQKKPVIVLMNLLWDSFPKWHYTLLVGIDKANDQIIMHSGSVPNAVMDREKFLSAWKKADYWGFHLQRMGAPRSTHPTMFSTVYFLNISKKTI